MPSRLPLLGSFLLLCAGVSTAAAADAPPPGPRVETYAGSGASGVADGVPALAQFIAPAGLAVDDAFRVYVADRGGQRIKVIDPGGDVRTLAGSGSPIFPGGGVAGGYRDGPAAAARFNQPLGVAVAKDGSVYVADLKNRCIRVIRNGIVSTFAGSPERVGHVDGDAGSASFSEPRSLAFASDGRLFVADYPNDIRVVSPEGRVTSFPFKKDDGAAYISSIAVVTANGDDVLLASSVTDLYEFDLRGNNRTADLKLGAPGGKSSIVFGTVVGPPSAFAGLRASIGAAGTGTSTMLFPDALDSGVVVCYPAGDNVADCKFLSRPPAFDAALAGGGYADGAARDALFDEPEGIAVAPDGTVFVADTGNKRIRRISGVRPTMPYLVERQSFIAEFPKQRTEGEYRIALVGNSAIDRGIVPEDGIAANLEHRLAPLAAANGKRLEVIPHGVPGLVLDQDSIGAIDEEFNTGLADVVVFDLPLNFDVPVGPEWKDAPERWSDGWLERTRASLRRLTRDLAAAGVTLYLYAHPIAYDVPGENVYLQFPKFTPSQRVEDDEAHIIDPSDVARLRNAVASLAADPQLHFIDLYPAIFEERAAPTNLPVFDSWDHHFTAYGAALIGRTLAERLAADAPWARH